MKGKYKKGAFIGVVVLMILGFAFILLNTGRLDVVSKYSKESFPKVIEGRDRIISEGARKGFEVVSPQGDIFGISYIKSVDGDFGTTGLSIYEIVDVRPFTDAGLNVDRLTSKTVFYDPQNKKLIIKRDLKNIPKKKFDEKTAETMAGLYSMLIDANRDILGFHEKLGHFGLSLGEGFMLEWAKDPATNDKDLVWVMDPAPLVDAGLNKDSLKEWADVMVPVMDKDGRKSDAEKFLRAYDFK